MWCFCIFYSFSFFVQSGFIARQFFSSRSNKSSGGFHCASTDKTLFQMLLDPDKNKPYIHFTSTENLLIFHLTRIIENFLGIMHHSIQGKLKCWVTVYNRSFRAKPWQLLIRRTWSIIPTQKPVSRLVVRHTQPTINVIRKWSCKHTDSEEPGWWMQALIQFDASLTLRSENISVFFFFSSNFTLTSKPSILWVCVEFKEKFLKKLKRVPEVYTSYLDKQVSAAERGITHFSLEKKANNHVCNKHCSLGPESVKCN